jgi:hypothetical protein
MAAVASNDHQYISTELRLGLVIARRAVARRSNPSLEA